MEVDTAEDASMKRLVTAFIEDEVIEIPLLTAAQLSEYMNKHIGVSVCLNLAGPLKTIGLASGSMQATPYHRDLKALQNKIK